MKKLLLLFSLVFLCGFVLAAPDFSSYTLYADNNNIAGSGAGFIQPAVRIRGNTFNSTQQFTLKGMSLYCQDYNSVDWDMVIYSTSGGLPNTVLSTTTVSSADVPDSGSPGWFNFSINDVTISPGVTYAFAPAITEISSGASIDCWISDSASAYLDGNRIKYEPSSWVADGNDLAFELWGLESVPSSITLDTPSNDSVSSAGSIVFNATIIPGTTYNITNATVNVWYSNGTLFNQTTNIIASNTTNVTTWNVTDFTLGSYTWNVEGCFDNSTDTNCEYAESNYTFTVGASILSETYSTSTYETLHETFSIEISLAEGSEISLVQLVYNNTNYSVSDITIGSNVTTINKEIDIPLNPNPYANVTKSFFWRFLFTSGETQVVQETSSHSQTIGYINFQQCNSSFPTQALNFTFFNEVNQTIITENISSNPTTFESSWTYWVGNGEVYKNYSFQNITSAKNNYQFCIFPYFSSNYTFKTSSDIDYSAGGYRENEYHLRNATLTNTSSDILLYLLDEGTANKFFLTFQQGSNVISDGIVTVQKYFTGTGQYKTTAILLTDSDGVATMWQEVDALYRYSVVKDSELLGTVDKVSVCSVAPCSLTIFLEDATSDILSPYFGIYAVDVLSNLTYNSTTKIVTYTFIDTTGLANYFRLDVREIKLNETGAVICDQQVYSPAGTLTCNMTGYSGEFIARGYISRSPEKIDQVLDFLTDENTIASLGQGGLLLVIGILITLVFGAAIISRGSPSAILFVFGIGILALKLIGWFPFTWMIVSAIEFLVLFIIWKVKT